METTKSDWKQARTIFEDSLLQPADARREHALELCGGDGALWEEVRSLLDWHESSDSFLETPAVEQIVERGSVRNQLADGQRLSHYEITRMIGHGGMGEVYLARDLLLDRNVAIKILRGDLLPHARGGERLLREARAVALLEHPNICHVYEIGEADGFSFIAMQYVVGTTLDEILASGTLHGAGALDLAVQIADGLAEAHSQGIVHRDIKPANIIVSNKGQAKILDFGLVKFVEGEKTDDGVSRLESWGGIMGTVPYMSPEQLVAGTVDARTDIFSFGAVLFEMLAGVPAFNRKRHNETIAAIVKEEPDWELISPDLHPLLKGCLAKDREDRYESGRVVADALEGLRKLGRNEIVALRQTDTTPLRPSTAESEAETASYSMAVTQGVGFVASPAGANFNRGKKNVSDPESDYGTSKEDSRSGRAYRLLGPRAALASAAAIIALSAGLFGYYFFTTSDSAGTAANNSAPRKLYWELAYANKRKFIRNRIIQIQTLIGDQQRGISDESLDGIHKEVDRYVRRRDSLSQEPFEEGLRGVYGRASQYVPMVSAEFDKQNVPTAIGIYQAIVESEYRDCLKSDTGPVGVFQLTKATAERFGLAEYDRCRVDLSAKAAAAYNSKLASDFAGDQSSWTLAILSFYQGEDLTLSHVRKLAEYGLSERSYWTISENREKLSDYNLDSDRYMRRFFAAAIIGENPEMFGLVTPPLSTIRTRKDLGISNVNSLVTIQGGTFKMGSDDTKLDFEKPEHVVSVNSFRMSKTEVTNSEYAEFISATGYKPKPEDSSFLAHWVNGLPLDIDGNTPVRFVNIEDIVAYIMWRSHVDGLEYRLPTEEEWEYAARNGSRNTLYPWGDKFDERCAFIDKQRNDPVAVGKQTCPNSWGVQDLIGNVFEWTATPAGAYPGSPVELAPQGEKYFMIRGGGAFDKSAGKNAITSISRHPFAGSRRSPGLGFRLVTSQ